MPVRRIPRYGAQKNIGKFSSVKTGRVAWYESLNERDFMYLLDFDSDVTYWQEQPLRIRFSHGGKTHWYTPDLEVHRGFRKQIVEVKCSSCSNWPPPTMAYALNQPFYQEIYISDASRRAAERLISQVQQQQQPAPPGT